MKLPLGIKSIYQKLEVEEKKVDDDGRRERTNKEVPRWRHRTPQGVLGFSDLVLEHGDGASEAVIPTSPRSTEKQLAREVHRANKLA